jgi:N6-adenosine-specific RNA methylase IME4/ParB-like chromosome segregation protein Spo0J
MKLSLRDIKVPNGRRPVGDIRELVASIERVGLLHPVVVTEDHQLVAGLHRLRACEQLGWTKIPVTIVPKAKLTNELAELDENLVRAELTVLQRAEGLARRKRIYEALHPETRRGVAGGKASGESRRGDRTSEPSSLVGTIADKMGVSRRAIELQVQIATDIPKDLRRILHGTWASNDKKSLLQLARLETDEQRAVIGRIVDGAGSVRLAKAQHVGSTLDKVKPPTGKYRVIVCDPPWDYEGSSEDYPTSSLDEIRALPVGRLAEDDAILWIWTTNLMMRHAYTMIDAWGFKEQTVLTWIKPRIGKGWYLRNQSEHCVVAIRGRPVLTLEGQSTVLHARTRERGRKPDEFYQLVESLCPGSKIDLYARQSRPGWSTWGAEATLFDRSVEAGGVGRPRR